MKKYLSVLLGIAFCLSVGFVSRLLHAEAMEVWYPTLAKSALTPPDIVFPIVWGLLYTLLGVCAGLVLCAQKLRAKKTLLGLFALQMGLNVTWNLLFFYMQSPLLGFINLLILDVLAAMFYVSAFCKVRSAAWFFLPYMLWMFFATYLNYYIFVSN